MQTSKQGKDSTVVRGSLSYLVLGDIVYTKILFVYLNAKGCSAMELLYGPIPTLWLSRNLRRKLDTFIFPE